MYGDWYRRDAAILAHVSNLEISLRQSDKRQFKNEQQIDLDEMQTSIDLMVSTIYK